MPDKFSDIFNPPRIGNEIGNLDELIEEGKIKTEPDGENPAIYFPYGKNRDRPVFEGRPGLRFPDGSLLVNDDVRGGKESARKRNIDKYRYVKHNYFLEVDEGIWEKVRELAARKNSFEDECKIIESSLDSPSIEGREEIAEILQEEGYREQELEIE